MKRSSLIAAVCALLAAGATAVGAGTQARAVGPATPVPVTPSAAASAVEWRELTDVYVADAVIEAVRQATVSAQIAGQITRLHADAGDSVKRGQLLATIDARETDAQVASSVASIAQAQAQLTQARLNYERTASLLKQNFVSQAALDQADADYQAARAAADVARAAATGARTARSFAEIRAPFDGVVSRRLADVGDLAVAGRPVFELHDPAALRAVGAVPQFMLQRVTGVSEAAVRVAASNESIRATRVTILPAADARLLSTQVRADLPPILPAGVAPGTAAKILLPIGVRRQLVMPADAVVRRGELTIATVVAADGSTRLRQIRIGESVDGDEVEVLSGLEAGERVLRDPLAVRRPAPR